MHVFTQPTKCNLKFLIEKLHEAQWLGISKAVLKSSEPQRERHIGNYAKLMALMWGKII